MRVYLFLIIAMGLLGSMCSRSSDVPRPYDAMTQYRGDLPTMPGSDAATAPSSSTNGQETVLERSGDGHFYADVQINGSNVRMLVDTGASAVALSRDDARSAGIATSISMPNVVGEGASGDVRGELVTIDRISLGGATAERVDAVVLDSGGMSLLGQAFLREFETIEIKDDRMVLR
jgi:aspartyl protease family protein